jgi:hypothetical protein
MIAAMAVKTATDMTFNTMPVTGFAVELRKTGKTAPFRIALGRGITAGFAHQLGCDCQKN